MPLSPAECELLHTTALFDGFSCDEIVDVLDCLGCRKKPFTRGDVLVRVGQVRCEIGVVISGSVLVSTVGADGVAHATQMVGRGEIYGEDLLWSRDRRAQYNVIAATSGSALLVGMMPIIQPQTPLCRLRSAVVENLFKTMAIKNRDLHRHLDVVTEKSLRDKVTAFLWHEAAKNNSLMFSLNFTRQELADHLNADRSALSRELSRMKTDGLIDYYRDSFKLFPAFLASGSQQISAS